MVSRAHRLLQISDIVGGCPDKESVVVDTFFGGSLQLHFHASQVGDGGLVVWHVKEGCDATAQRQLRNRSPNLLFQVDRDLGNGIADRSSPVEGAILVHR